MSIKIVLKKFIKNIKREKYLIFPPERWRLYIIEKYRIYNLNIYIVEAVYHNLSYYFFFVLCIINRQFKIHISCVL